MRAALPGVLALTLLVTACGGENEAEQPPIDPAAAALADALTTGDFSRVPSSGDPAGEFATIMEGMHGMHPKVDVGDITTYPTSAEVKLDTTWHLSSPWTYRTTALFQLIDGEWQLEWSPQIIAPELTGDTRLERTSVDSQRGHIVGAEGFALTQSGPATLIGIDPKHPDAEKSARTLAEEISMNADEFAERVKDHHGDGPVFATALRADATPATVAEIPGVVEEPVNLPTAPASSSARALTGWLGTATLEEAGTSGGTMTPGSIVGRGGLEKARDEKLRGIGATRVYLVPRELPVGQVDDDSTLLADYPEAPGGDVQTTINGDVQAAVDEVLAETTDPTSIVAIRPRTGELLAVGDSSGPARAGSHSLTESFSPETAAAPIGALALVRKGVTISDEEVTCDDEVDVEGRKISESELSQSSTNTTLEQAIAQGCSTALTTRADRVDGAALTHAASSLGVGVDHDLGVPTSFGDIKVGPSKGDVAEAMAGRGGLRVSPLGMASMAATITSGFIIVPWVSDDLKPKPEGQPPLTPAEGDQLRELMETGASSGLGSNISGADGALMGYDGERAWVMGYSDEVAFAVVTHTESPSRYQIAQLAGAVTQAAAQSSSNATPRGEN